MAKLISYNVNGIRAAQKKGLFDWIKKEKFDIVCVQETKAHQDQVKDNILLESGYTEYWHSAEKKGYSGVAIFTKIKPDFVEHGCGIEKYDREGRIIRADFGDVTLLNIYFPSGSSGMERQAFKMEFLADLFKWIKKLKKKRPNLIVVGDYNIAHTEMDIHNPVSNKKSSGFLPEEREWLTKWFKLGFVDVFRFMNPDKQKYSWWTFRFNARKNNKGWRIDYISVTEPLKKKIKSSELLNDAVHSDHCPVFVDLKL